MASKKKKKKKVVAKRQTDAQKKADDKKAKDRRERDNKNKSKSVAKPTSSSSATKYYNISGAYFSGTPGNLKAVNDRDTINKLKSGSVKSSSGTSSLLFGSKERIEEDEADVAKTTKDSKDKTQTGTIDDTDLRASTEFKNLRKEDQEAVLAVFGAVAGNDLVKAKRLAEAFKANAKINDPYFKQQLRLAIDAIERGYVAIDEEADFTERQMKSRYDDIKKDYESRAEYLDLEEASQIKAIERQYEMDLEDTRQNMAATGMSSSTRRIKKEEILNEVTGDLRQSTNRKFGFERTGERDKLTRAERDTQRELARLAEITKAGKLDFLRKAEEQVGTGNLPRLSGAPGALGDIYGSIPEQQLKDTIAASTSFVF